MSNQADIINYLQRSFAKATSNASAVLGNKTTTTRIKGRLVGTPLYDLQVDFCYILNEIKRGPNYIASKRVQEANYLIDKINALV